jgi:RimJ/RimL family protein N-acetyltransferase
MAMDDARLDTARLTGRPPAEADLPELRELFRHPDFAATMSADGAPWPDDRVALFVERARAHWRLYGFGVHVFRDAQAALAGYCGLRLFLLEGEPVVELLYGVAPACHRRGYATEMARALLADGERRLGIRDVAAWTLHRNVGSRKVMHACGFAYQRDIVYAGLPHVLYRRHAG